MCGIAGAICGDAAVALGAVRVMTDWQTHRGPDGAGHFSSGIGHETLALGHRRLAILDPSEAGAQPMVHPNTGDVLAYNGEIYNFRDLRRQLTARGCRFKGDSDSEVLLHALVEWGLDGLSRLEGMFAFAFFRAAQRDVTLVRDPLGMKPLYIGRLPGALLFASEARAILQTGMASGAVDARGLAGYFAYGACQHPFTLFEGITSLAPGHSLRIRAGRVEDAPSPHWVFPRPTKWRGGVAPAAAVRDAVDDAVRRHLVSDVPLGISLSSGIDSTIVAGLAARHAPGAKSFTVGFAEHPDLSELQIAAESARCVGLEHNVCRIESADALAATTHWLDRLDLPSIDGLNVYVISQAIRARGVKVFLSGQGGDELFGGYATFRHVPRLRSVMGHVQAIPPLLRGQMARLATLRASSVQREKAQAIAESAGDILSLYALRRGLMGPAQLAAMGLEPAHLGLTETCLDRETAQALAGDEGDAVWAVSRLESRLYLGNMLLRDGDANSMAHGIEVRMPLLDRRVLDLAAALPGSARLNAGRADKMLLRQAFPELLRPEILGQRKRGFTLPIGRWMLGPLRETCLEGLDHLAGSGFVDERGVAATWSAFTSAPESPAWSRAFACCVLGLYLRGVLDVARRRRAS